MVQVLFLCLGNICRSPMAEAIFRHHVKEKGLQQQFVIDSAGTAGWHEGKLPHEGTRSILDKYQISYEGMKARQIQPIDGETFDYIVAMDDQNVEDLKKILKGNHKSMIVKLTDFLTTIKADHVPDPYYTKNFDYTYKLVNEGTKNLLGYLIKKHHIQ